MYILYNGAARRFRGWLVLLLTTLTTAAFAQTGEISGIVRDEKGEPFIGATVIVTEGGILKGGSVTGPDGDYLVKPLTAGTYDIQVTAIGLDTTRQTGIPVSSGITNVDLVLYEPRATTSGGGGGGQQIAVVTVRASRYVKPLVQRNRFGAQTDFVAEDIERAATRSILDVASKSTGTYQARNGGGISIGGGRQENTLVIIDGILQRGQGAANRLPFGSVGQMSVITGGLPAKYGDATGGVISITTKGVTARVQGSVGAEHSVDGYNNRQAYFNLTGPLVKRTIRDTAGNVLNRVPLIGFSVSGNFAHNQDNNPSWVPNYVVREDVLQRLQENPYVAVPGITGVPTLRNATEFVRAEDLETVRRRVNAQATSASLLTKFDLAIGENMNFTLGGQGFYSRGDNYSRAVALFSPEAIGQSTSYTGQGFARFVQRFPARDTGSTIQSAFYTVQVDYQKTYGYNQDPNHKRDAFKYGYVGKFYQDESELYARGFDDSSGKAGILLQPGLRFFNTRFERSELNPLLANYTSQVFNLFNENISAIGVRDVRAFQGLLNGDLPVDVYGAPGAAGLFSNVGIVQRGYGYNNSDQLSVGIDASVDVQTRNKMRHSLEFGLYFQQQSSRSYSVNALRGGTSSLWEQAHLLTNTHFFGTQDRSNPIFVVNGQRYTIEDVRAGRVNPGPDDTILYNTIYNQGEQTTFDRNLRRKLGLAENNVDYINVYELDPSLLSVDMFAPDELFNSGRSYVNYLGYDYKGKRAGNSSFTDFWTARDENGMLTRPVSAFRPNYVAGYISDNFILSRNMMFNLGVRVDRYDANTSVLKDPYSLYETYKKGNAPNAVNFNNGGTDANNAGHPGNISDDAVVYVSSFGANPEIVGYREGDNWYDPFGRLVEDPNTLKQYTGGRDPLPYLVDPSDDIQADNFDPTKSFEDYKPQVNVMPRISFAFNITDLSRFYAHYNVVVQRPTAGVALTPLDYYFIETNPTNIINNPNLRPERTTDYEVGLEQALTRPGARGPGQAVTLSAFYRERRDQIQIRPYLYAWPTTYYTFGNRDFSTTKGLRVKYDLRRTGPFELLVSYTLQFAEGTGSDIASSNAGRTDIFQTGGILNNFISAGLPNIRYPFALDIDSRHNIVVTADYRYFAYDSVNGGGGPRIGRLHPFQNMGANLTFRTRSGEPFTRYDNPITNIVAGGVNGARLPWHYMFDLNVDKDFALFRRNSDGTAVDGSKQRYLNAFVYVQNLFNTRDVLGVYGYSGRPDDDGFLESPQGQQQVQQQTDPAAYADLYRISRNGPGFFNLPRRVNVGVRFNF